MSTVLPKNLTIWVGSRQGISERSTPTHFVYPNHVSWYERRIMHRILAHFETEYIYHDAELHSYTGMFSAATIDHVCRHGFMDYLDVAGLGPRLLGHPITTRTRALVHSQIRIDYLPVSLGSLASTAISVTPKRTPRFLLRARRLDISGEWIVRVESRRVLKAQWLDHGSHSIRTSIHLLTVSILRPLEFRPTSIILGQHGTRYGLQALHIVTSWLCSRVSQTIRTRWVAISDQTRRTKRLLESR